MYNKYPNNMFSAWNDFAGENDLRILLSGEKTASILEQNGKMIIDAGGMTTQELTDAMVATGELTRTQAEMMIADFKNYSADFAAEMAASDLPNVIKEWIANLPSIDDGTTKIFDEADITTLAALLGKEEGEIRALINQLKDDATELRGIKWTDDNGERTADSIKNALREAGINDISSKRDIPRSNDYIEIFNYDKMKLAYQDLGIPLLFESDFNKVAAESGKFFANIFGKGLPVSIEEGETAGEAYARAYLSAVNQDLADKMGEVFKEAFQEIEITINTTDSDTKLEKTLGQLDTIKDGAEGTVSIIDHASEPLKSITKLLSSIKDKTVTVTVKLNMTGQLVATGGIVKSFADGSGTRYVQPGFALTGEEGPEIVWNKEQGYAYVTGKNGAEFQNLLPGDRVFNAAETLRIFRNSSFASGGMVPSYAEGYDNATKPKKSSSGGGSGGGSSDDKDDEWKNDLDWLYNVMENIAELERLQTDLLEQYDDLLTDQTKTGYDLYKMLIKLLGNLHAQLDHLTYTLERREQEMREFMDTTNDEDEYLWYNWEDRTLEIDWDAIDLITDQDKYDHIKDLIDEAESIQDKMDDAEDAVTDIENQIQELENIWRDTFTDFEERVLDAIVKMYQTVIDNYSELNDTLNLTNTNILDAINKEISLLRLIRDNTKTEQEIADNEAQLAYLQRDTTGGNALEALLMGKDLDDLRQDYLDNLIDLAILKLQDSNDMAALQRERLIEIMLALLDYLSANGEFNAYIRDLMTSAIDEDGHLATDSDLYKLLAELENADAMTKVGREVWEEELNGTFKEVMAFLLKELGEAEGTYFTAVTAAFNGISETFDKAFHGSYSQGGAGSGSSGSGKSSSSTSKSKTRGKDKDDDLVKKAYDPNRKGQALTNPNLNTTTIKTKDSATVSSLLRLEKLKKKEGVKVYATGGLNTQNGLAWLDGTPSEPEYVLNARQTNAFLKLADVLPAAVGTSGQNVSNTFGATTNNVVINVDKIDSDYSVDQMVDRVKEKLFESGSYRNNNVLSLLR